MKKWIDKGIEYLKHPASQIFLTQSFGNGIGLLTGIAVANYMSVDAKAEVDQFRLVVNFITEFSSFGLASGFLYYTTKDRTFASKALGSTILFTSILFLIAVLSAFTAYDEASHVLKGIPLIIFRLAVIMAPFKLMSNLLYGIQQGIGRPLLFHIGGLIEAFILLGSVLGLHYFGDLTSSNFIVLSSVGILAGSLFSLIMLRRDKLGISFDGAAMKEAALFGWPIYVGLLLNYLHFRIDELMINYYLSKKDYAIYSVSVRWAEMIFLIDSAILGASLQRIGSYDKEEGYRYSFKILRIQAPITLLAAVAFLGLSYLLIFNLYQKPEYHESWRIMALLLPGISSWSIARIFSQYLVFNQGKRYWMIVMNILGLCLNLCLNLAFIKRYGLVSVSLSSSASYFTVLVVVYLMMLKTKSYAKTNS